MYPVTADSPHFHRGIRSTPLEPRTCGVPIGKVDYIMSAFGSLLPLRGMIHTRHGMHKAFSHIYVSS